MSIVTEMKNQALKHHHARHRITDHDMIDCWNEENGYKFLRNQSPITEDAAREIIDGVTVKPNMLGARDRIAIAFGPSEELERYIHAFCYRVRLEDGLTTLKLTSSVDAGLEFIAAMGYRLDDVTTIGGAYEVRLVGRGPTETFKAATLPLAIAGAAMQIRQRHLDGVMGKSAAILGRMKARKTNG